MFMFLKHNFTPDMYKYVKVILDLLKNGQTPISQHYTTCTHTLHTDICYSLGQDHSKDFFIVILLQSYFNLSPMPSGVLS